MTTKYNGTPTKNELQLQDATLQEIIIGTVWDVFTNHFFNIHQLIFYE